MKELKKKLGRQMEKGLPYFTARGWLAIAACGALGGIVGGLLYGIMMEPFIK